MLTSQTPDAAPALSLCMIVRDEAELLPRFLEHAQGLWDELVVVDTGSRDQTIPLLQQAGARIVERPWTGDFAAARNAGLELARGRWILFLDADEMISPELVAQIKALVADPQAGAATLQMRNLLPRGNHRQSGLLRLFRNDPHIRFRHRIHEEVGTAVQAFLGRTGLQLRHLPGTVLHLGYVRERAQAKNKQQRDSELLWRSVGEDANDFYSWFKLLELGRFWNDPQLAQRAAEGCLAALDRAGPEALAGKPFGGELVVLIAGGLYPQDADRSAALLARWEPGLEPSAAFHLRAGELAELRRRPDEAARRFQRCLELADRTADVQLATVRPLMGLARLALGRPDGLDLAWDFTRQALSFNPRDREALLAALAICRTAGGQRLLDQFIAQHRERHGASDDLEDARRELLGLPSPAQQGP
jgi:hypothetical protein